MSVPSLESLLAEHGFTFGMGSSSGTVTAYCTSDTCDWKPREVKDLASGRRSHAAHVAAVVRDAHTIRTVNELNALPDGTMILDHDYEVAAKDEFGWHAWGDESGDNLFDLEAWVPARIVHLPSWPNPVADEAEVQQ